MSPDPIDPYQPPSASVPLPSSAAVSDLDATRHEHLKTEASIRGVGCLWLIGLPAAVGLLAVGISEMKEGTGNILLTIFLTVFVALQGVVGIMLRKLSPAARIPAIIFAVIGLAGFPIGTLISIYILVLLLRPKGKRVLAPDYRDIIKATPHIKYRTPVWVWIFLVVILLAILAAALLPLIASGA